MGDGYRFTEDFERAVLGNLCLSALFWARIGPAIEPEAFSGEVQRLVASAACSLGKELGRGPGSATLVLQRIARWRDEGRVTHEQVLDADDLLGELEEAGDDGPDTDAVVAELVPVLRERRNRAAVKLAIKTVGQRGEMTEVIEHLQATARLGTAQVVAGTSLGPGAFDMIQRLRRTERLSLGVPELDGVLGGGPPVKTLTVFMGGAGDGKSMALCHSAGSALLHGLNVSIATLELAEDFWLARLISNLTGIPIDSVQDGSLQGEAEARLAELSLGRCIVGYFTPGATEVSDLIAWENELAQREGWRPDVRIVDYADLLGHSKSRDYEGMREVYGGLRQHAVSMNGWALTASQSRRQSSGGSGRNKPSKDDGADSQHKIRVADDWIILSLSEDGTMMDYFVAKNRSGKAGGRVSLPTELECARIAPSVSTADEAALELF